MIPCNMPSVTTGANIANREMTYIGVSGDGDSLSIGVGQFVHAIRRNLNMCYILENNGVYGLTKGQFSASADIGSKPKKGLPNQQEPIDPVSTALSLGATYIARSFSGDKAQLVPLIKGALLHKGFSLVDIISPCVTFNDHEGSTKSYAHTREFYNHVVDVDYISLSEEITAEYEEGSAMPVALHDGSRIMLRKLDRDYDPTSRARAFKYLRDRFNAGEIVTGKIEFDGRDLLQLPESEMQAVRGGEIAMIFQDPMTALNPVFSVGNQMIDVLRRHRSLTRRQASARHWSRSRPWASAAPTCTSTTVGSRASTTERSWATSSSARWSRARRRSPGGGRRSAGGCGTRRKRPPR